MGHLELTEVCKGFGQGDGSVNVLRDVDLDVADGEFVAILGYSGTGKSTLISLIAGLESPDTGQIYVDNQKVEGAGRDRSVIFQNHALMPWRTVSGNVRVAVDAAFPQLDWAERKARVQHYVDMVGLTQAADKKPAELSGGMRQRVAVARALASGSSFLLMDEPFSALDALTRGGLQNEMLRITQTERRTIVMITNSVDEAILLADRVIVMTRGPGATLEREFRPQFERPRDRKSILADPGFLKLRTQISNHLQAMEVPRNSNLLPEGYKAICQVSPSLSKVWPASAHNKDNTPLGPAIVTAEKVTKVYDTPTGPQCVLNDVSFSLRRGEFVSIIGHSGCGKSTLLSMMAGLTDITSGTIVQAETSSKGSGRAMVFQEPSLFPWFTTRQNIDIALRSVAPDLTPDARAAAIDKTLQNVGLLEAANQFPGALSRGMQQRVGLARALGMSPSLLLMDEPFGMLDQLTRYELQDVVLRICEDPLLTTICVTHDVDEAVLLSDRVLMMSNGPSARIEEIVEVNLPRPRLRDDLVETAHFNECRQTILRFLQDGGPLTPKTTGTERIAKPVEAG